MPDDRHMMVRTIHFALFNPGNECIYASFSCVILTPSEPKLVGSDTLWLHCVQKQYFRKAIVFAADELRSSNTQHSTDNSFRAASLGQTAPSS